MEKKWRKIAFKKINWENIFFYEGKKQSEKRFKKSGWKEKWHICL